MRREDQSLNQSLSEGSTDGKYRKVRPNTTVAPGMGDEIVRANRADLNPYWNYDFIEQEKAVKVEPGSDKAVSAPRRSVNVADVANNKMLGTY